MYRPLRVFLALGGALVVVGILPGIRFIYLFSIGQRVGHVQSLILAAILIIVGLNVSLVGLLADLLSCNRKHLEELVYRVRKLEATRAPKA
jgi:formate hydrogenlyase subunit 3/multisubunit Na+/H+ antiporter MnhD subunit